MTWSTGFSPAGADQADLGTGLRFSQYKTAALGRD